MKRKKNMEQTNLELRKLISILEPYSRWQNEKCSQDDAAKTALLDFFEKYKDIELDEETKIGSWNSYFSYFGEILPIRRALMEGWYANACDEIVSLDHYQFMTQRRVYDALMGLYHEYLKGDCKSEKI